MTYMNGGGGTGLERSCGDVQPWRPPFHAFPVVRKGSISSKRAYMSVHKAPFENSFEILASTALVVSKFYLLAPNIEIFSSQDAFFRSKNQFASPTLWKSGTHIPTWKKFCAPQMGHPCMDVQAESMNWLAAKLNMIESSVCSTCRPTAWVIAWNSV